MVTPPRGQENQAMLNRTKMATDSMMMMTMMIMTMSMIMMMMMLIMIMMMKMMIQRGLVARPCQPVDRLPKDEHGLRNTDTEQ